MEYQEAINWLFSTQQFGIKLGLDAPRHLLRKFSAWPKHGVQVAHIAGTNGKGSTCAMMERVARACGKKTGLFTSPHLIDYRERMRVCGEVIPARRCAELITEARALCETLETHPTFFEITLAVAMRWFGEKDCELIILETGMGGRLDATTAVPADVCVVTPIGMDHTQWLGDTLAKIASEKAGIFLEGVPAFSSPQQDEARFALQKSADAKGCTLSFIESPLDAYEIALAGEHQKWNAALALAALQSLELSMERQSIAEGLSKVSWPGRFEKIISSGQEIILDGAHNPHAAKVLRETWLEKKGLHTGTLIFGAVESKDVSGILVELSDLCERVILCKVGTTRGLATTDLVQALPKGLQAECFENFSEALHAAQNTGPILVAGSLFLVGEARAQLLGGDFLACAQ
jgi:dihydrofolate synthase / folylpolyglutamate synthase